MIAYDPSDDIEVVPVETYRESIHVLADMCAQYRIERDEARADANAAMQLLTEARMALAEIMETVLYNPILKEYRVRDSHIARFTVAIKNGAELLTEGRE